MGKLQGKVALVTGASRGIGKEIARLFAAEGAKVACAARTVEEGDHPLEGSLATTIAEIVKEGGQAIPIAGDVSSFEDCERLVHETRAAFGPIDVLVNNAGISQRTLMLETGVDAYRRLFEIDFFAPVVLAKALLPEMLVRGAGHVVNVSSVFGTIAMARRSGYAAAKHALHGFFDCARIELGARGIEFTTVCPGFVRTAISVNALGPEGKPWGEVDHDIGRGMPPERCAQAIWNAVERNRPEVVIAGRERIAVWLKRFAPLSLYTAFARRLNVS
jgi:NAD(P)-dependent dehydrogenase (short-subunit alcohol dehydrogenase family)